ncbi:DUF899 family protein [Nonomuraea salmonea]|uniref:DUF899 family protein n=1 Tax=Nonomuraea salmonea TaxID=46181 RepID=UPI003CD06924
MTSSASAQPGRPPVADLATWQAARDELLVREKAHTREGDAIAAARRRLPMVEFDGSVKVTGPGGPVPFLELFQGRDELVVYKHMWYDGAPPQGQCEGCTTTAWHLKDSAYLNARGVSFAVVTPRRVGRGSRVRRVHGLHPAVVLHPRRGGAGRRADGLSHQLPARRRAHLPHLLDDGPGLRTRQPVPGAARHDAVRARRDLGGQARGLAGGGARLLVLAYGRRGELDVGRDQPPHGPVDPPRRHPGHHPRPPRHLPLTRA